MKWENRKDHGYSGVQGLTIDEVRFNNEEVDKALFSIDGNGVFRATNRWKQAYIVSMFPMRSITRDMKMCIYLCMLVPGLRQAFLWAVYREPMDRDYWKRYSQRET